MTGRRPTVQRASVAGSLREQRQRLRRVEAPVVGQWAYVLPISPATTPADFIESPGPPVAFVQPTFENGTSNVVGSQPVSFRIHPATRLAMRGAVDLHGAALPVRVFTLPEGFRPSYPSSVVFPSTDGASVFTGRVDPDGGVWLLSEITA